MGLGLLSSAARDLQLPSSSLHLTPFLPHPQRGRQAEEEALRGSPIPKKVSRLLIFWLGKGPEAPEEGGLPSAPWGLSNVRDRSPKHSHPPCSPPSVIYPQREATSLQANSWSCPWAGGSHRARPLMAVLSLWQLKGRASGTHPVKRPGRRAGMV